MKSNSPVSLNQYIANTCFLNAALQSCRIPFDIILSNSKVNYEDCQILNLFLNVINTGTKKALMEYFSFISSNRFFSDVSLDSMDDSVGFVRNMFDCVLESLPNLSEYVTGYIIPPDSIKCPDCNFIIPKMPSTRMLLISLNNTPITYPILSNSLSVISCLKCKSINIDRFYQFPKVLLIQIGKYSGEGERVLDKFFYIDNIHYQLYSVILSSGIHTTCICYYPTSNKWYYCNDSEIREYHMKQGHFFKTNSLILGAIYIRVTRNDIISNKSLLQVIFENDIDHRLNLNQAQKVLKFWPTILKKPIQFKEDIRYSRQAYITHYSARKNFAIENYHVLIVGLNQTTFEVVKNLVCMGFLNISIAFSDYNMNYRDINKCFLWSNNIYNDKTFDYLKLKDFIKSNINQNALLKLFREEISVNSLKLFSVECIVVTQHYIGDVISLNNIAREASVKFIAGDSIGLYINTFIDFGDNFKYKCRTGDPDKDEIRIFLAKIKTSNDLDNEKNKEMQIETWNFPFLNVEDTIAIIKENSFKNTIIKITKCDIKSGDVTIVTTKEIAHKIEKYLKTNPRLLVITTPKDNTKKFNKLESEISKPSFCKDEPYSYIQNIYSFNQYIKYRKNDSLSNIVIDKIEIKQELLELIDSLEQLSKMPENVKLTFIDKLISSSISIKYTMVGYSPIMCTLLGGIISHSVLVAGSQSFPPIPQWISQSFSQFFDNNIINERTGINANQLFPAKILHELKNLNILQVGCGATGCETTKLLCEIGAGEYTNLNLVDSDIFSPSNRNRQFLCFESQRYNAKSKVVKETISRYYPKRNITPFVEKLSESSPEFDLEFYNQMDVVIGTVDNVKARRFCSEMVQLSNNNYFIECGTSSLIYSCSFFFPSSPLYPAKTNRSTQKNCNPTTFCFLDSHTISAAVITFENWFTTHLNSVKDIDLTIVTNNHNRKHYALITKLYLKAIQNTNQIEKLFETLFNIEFYKNLSTIKDKHVENLKYCNVPKPVKYNKKNGKHKLCFDTFKKIFLSNCNNKLSINSTEFDKENDSHLDLVRYLADIKCDCFSIKERDFTKWRIQRIAGHSIPSIISSTAVAAALNCLNLYSIASLKAGFKNTSPVNISGELTAYNFVVSHSTADFNFQPYSIPIKYDICIGEFKDVILKYFDSFWDDAERMTLHHISCKIFSKTFSKDILLSQQKDIDNKILTEQFKLNDPPEWIRVTRNIMDGDESELLAKLDILDLYEIIKVKSFKSNEYNTTNF